MGKAANLIPADALHPTWEDMAAMAASVADKVAQAGEQVDGLVVLPRGGLFPANIIARRLDISGSKVLSAALTSYAAGAFERGAEFTVGQFPTRQEVQGKSLLVVDEVCDTGNTLAEVVARLRKLGAANVRSAVLHYKPGRSTTGYAPDFYATETDAWIMYPWEWHEQPFRAPREGAGISAKLAQASAADAS